MTLQTKLEVLDILKTAVEKDASDIHIKVGVPPIFRIHRQLHSQATIPAITADDITRFFNSITTDEQKRNFNRDMELDFAHDVPDIGRFRVNAYWQIGTIGLVFRYVRTNIPSLEQLGVPKICMELSMKREGMIIVTGPTGCGKSTTLAAMLSHMNQHTKRNIITIEDPIEFLHSDNGCTFSQREVGADTTSFGNALRHVLRQDPDVILIGEMRDVETMATALTAAETGHLVLATLHTPSSYGAVDRLVDAFPPHQHQQIRLQLSSILQAVVYQVLVPRADGRGIIPAVEVLIATPAIRNLIREGKTFQMPNFMHTGQDSGMQTIDQALFDLYRQGLITSEETICRMRAPENLTQGEELTRIKSNGGN